MLHSTTMGALVICHRVKNSAAPPFSSPSPESVILPSHCCISDDHGCPRHMSSCKEFCCAAVLETNPEVLVSFIRKAETALFLRELELAVGLDGRIERLEIEHAASALRILTSLLGRAGSELRTSLFANSIDRFSPFRRFSSASSKRLMSS